MKFNVNTFQPLIVEREFAVRRKSLFLVILISSFKDLDLKHIGMKELEFIWQKKLEGTFCLIFRFVINLSNLRK